MRKYWSVLLLIPSICLLAPRVEAQWTKLGNFGPSAVYSIYFLDGLGIPDIGFVGCGGDIFRTADGGASWQRVATGIMGSATDFAFKDARTGWCSIGGTKTSPAILKTVDGGTTWTPLSVLGVASDVYYNAATKMLFLSIRLSGGTSLKSSDDGVSWTALTNQLDENGFVFVDPMRGILTAHTTPFYHTTDGGQTWTNTFHIQHSWSPCVLPRSSTIISAEDQAYSLFISTDAGNIWGSAGSVPIPLTGCVRPGQCGVYAQTSGGIYESMDLKNWSLIGGPGNQYDTRFYVTNSEIYAGDMGGNVYSLPSGSGNWPSLRFQPANISITQASGCTASLAIAAFQNIACIPLTILSAALTDNTRWSLQPTTLPRTLYQGDTIQFHLTGDGRSPGSYLANLRLHVQTQYGITDTLLPLKITVLGMIPPTLHSLSVSLKNQCTPLDTTVRLHNNHCDTISITSLSLLDSTLFDLAAIQLPILIPPDSDLLIPIRTKAPHRGAFADTLILRLQYKNYSLDTSLILQGLVKASAIQASLSTARMSFDTVAGCGTRFDTVWLHDLSCDSVQITEELLSYNSMFKLLTSHLGERLGYGDSVPFIVSLSATIPNGNYFDELDLMLDNGVYQQQYPVLLSGTILSTSGPASFVARGFSVDSLACPVYDTTLIITGHGRCDSSLEIASINYQGTGQVTIETDKPLPRLLTPVDTLRYTLHISLGSHAAVDGFVHIVGDGIDTLLPVHLSLKLATQNMATMRPARSDIFIHSCDLDTTTVYLSNASCVPDTIDALYLSSDTSGFVLGAHYLPIVLPAGGGMSVTLHYSPGHASDDTVRLIEHQTIAGVGMTADIPLRGHAGVGDTARLGLALLSPAQVVAGSIASAAVYFASVVPDSVDLRSLRCKLDYDDNVLTVRAINGKNGWSIQQESSPQGQLSLLCSRSSGNSIASKDQLCTIDFFTTISDSLWSSVTLTTAQFTPEDASYERCTLASQIEAPRVEVHLLPQCADSLLTHVLRGDKLVISDVMVRPNPVGTNDEQTLDVSFTSNTDRRTTLSLQDALGRERFVADFNATDGNNTVSVPIAALTSGGYYLVLKAGRVTKITPIQVLR